MDDILKLADETYTRAWQVIQDTRVREAWEMIGAKVNLVGSLQTRLLIKNLDIDFHIYSFPFRVAGSFRAMGVFASSPGVKRISYKNLMDSEEQCLEWHARVEDGYGDTWQIDMVHFPSDSPYAGRFERVAERVNEVLSDETREAILTIKHAAPEDQKVKGIEVVMAVLRDGIRTYEDYIQWREKQEFPEIIDWEP
jgi:hypothetical protein